MLYLSNCALGDSLDAAGQSLQVQSTGNPPDLKCHAPELGL